MTLDAETLGKIVRAEWIAYCHETGDTKASHVAAWDDMTEAEREVDRRIGLAVAKAVRDSVLAMLDKIFEERSK